jgi:DNA-directed RNA polymerase subunit RPC12/RpoP
MTKFSSEQHEQFLEDANTMSNSQLAEEYGISVSAVKNYKKGKLPKGIKEPKKPEVIEPEEPEVKEPEEPEIKEPEEPEVKEPEDSKYVCSACGEKFNEKKKHCPGCGEELDFDKSGSKTKEPEKPKEPNYECGRCGFKFDERYRHCPSCGLKFA